MLSSTGVLKWSNVGYLVKLIREETGMPFYVARSGCLTPGSLRDMTRTFCLGRSLNLTGLFDADRSETTINWCGKAVKLWYTLTEKNSRARWFGPRRGKTAGQTPGSTCKNLVKCLEEITRKCESEGGPGEAVEAINLVGWRSEDKEDDEGPKDDARSATGGKLVIAEPDGGDGKGPGTDAL